MTKPRLVHANGEPLKQPENNDEVVALLDAVLDLAVAGTLKSVAIVMVENPGSFRVAAAGPHLDGLMNGAKSLQTNLQMVIDQQTPKPTKTVIHNG